MSKLRSEDARMGDSGSMVLSWWYLGRYLALASWRDGIPWVYHGGGGGSRSLLAS